MTVIDFHPEELLEREASGALSAVEQRRLHEHLARCSSCRLERQLRLDFERELGPQGVPDMLQALVSGALRAAGSTERSPGVETAIVPRLRARRWQRPLATLLAAGVALGTGLAAARPDLARRALDFARDQALVLLGETPTPTAHSAAAPPAPPRDTPTAAPPPTLREPTETSPPSLEPERETSARSGKAEDPSRRLDPGAERERSERSWRSAAASSDGEYPSGAGAPRGARAQRAELGERPRADSPETPASLFDRANAARRGGSGAEALYEQLQARYPESPEARLSQAILGRMKLDSGEATAALAHFETYLSTADRALREQAMAGCALAWGRLGRSERERQSWRALLAAYPGSAYARLARQRLAGEVP